MIFTFYRALGLSTGASMVEEDFVDMARDLMDKAEARGVKLLLPKDVVVADRFAADAATKVVSIRPNCPDMLDACNHHHARLNIHCFPLRRLGRKLPVVYTQAIQFHHYMAETEPISWAHCSCPSLNDQKRQNMNNEERKKRSAHVMQLLCTVCRHRAHWLLTQYIFFMNHLILVRRKNGSTPDPSKPPKGGGE